MIIDKYKEIFPEISNLDNEQFITNYTVHIIHNINYKISICKNTNKLSTLKKLLIEIEKYNGYYSLKELKKKGFDENQFFENLKTVLIS